MILLGISMICWFIFWFTIWPEQLIEFLLFRHRDSLIDLAVSVYVWLCPCVGIGFLILSFLGVK